MWLRWAPVRCLQLPGLLTASPLAPLWQGMCLHRALARACAAHDQLEAWGLGRPCKDLFGLFWLYCPAVALFAPLQLP